MSELATRIRSAIILLAVFLCLTGTARAQLFLEEGKVVLAASGGDRIDKTIMIHNNSTESVDVTVYWEDFQYEPPYDGTKLFLPAGTGERSMSNWISYSPRYFSLAPYAKQEVTCSISVPAVFQGGAYGVLFFENKTVGAPEGVAVNIVTRVGSLFFLESKDKDKTCSITDIAASATGITGTFANSGDVVLIPKVTYYLTDQQEMIADRGELKKMYVAPGGTASWELPFSESLSAGSYEMVLTADLGEGDVKIKELTLVKDPFGGVSVRNVRD